MHSLLTQNRINTIQSDKIYPVIKVVNLRIYTVGPEKIKDLNVTRLRHRSKNEPKFLSASDWLKPAKYKPKSDE